MSVFVKWAKKKYIDDLLKRSGKTKYKEIEAPLAENAGFVGDKKILWWWVEILIDKRKYGGLIGSLNCGNLSSYPGIAWSSHVLKNFFENPRS